MDQERIEVGKQPQITISECQGNLIIRGGMETAVFIKGESYDVQESELGHTFSATGDLRLTVPMNCQLEIGEVHGDLTIKNIQSDVTIQNVSGDVSLRTAAAAKINTVHGDLAAKNLTSDLTVEIISGDAFIRNCGELIIGTVRGDLLARQVNGMAQLAEVMGDLNLRNIRNDLTIKQGGRDANLRGLSGKFNHLSNIGGDIRLYGPLMDGNHTFFAGGDIVLRWPDTAAINLTAAASNISNWLPLEDVTEENDTLTGRIGTGDTNVTLTAAGSISLKEAQPIKEKWVGDEMDFDFDFDFDMADFTEKINAQVFAHVNRITDDLEKQFGPDFSERIARKAEKAAAKAEKAAERALRQAERSFKRSWPGRTPSPPKPPPQSSPTKSKASEAEQLKILKMVEKGVISPDEAGTLLEALEN